MRRLIRQTVDLHGIVQGVGLRPTVYRLAREAGLGGWVQNRTGSVRLDLEGEADAVARFAAVGFGNATTRLWRGLRCSRMASIAPPFPAVKPGSCR